MKTADVVVTAKCAVSVVKGTRAGAPHGLIAPTKPEFQQKTEEIGADSTFSSRLLIKLGDCGEITLTLWMKHA